LYSCHNSHRVTPGRLSSACTSEKSGSGRRDSRRYRRACSASSSSSSASGQTTDRLLHNRYPTVALW
jgi:hypothetical protein